MDKICELLPWFAAGTLSEGERQQVLLHLAKCADCRRELPWLLELSRDIKTTTAALPACGKPAEPPQADYNLRLLEHYSPTVPGVQVTERVYRLHTPFGTVPEAGGDGECPRRAGHLAWGPQGGGNRVPGDA